MTIIKHISKGLQGVVNATAYIGGALCALIMLLLVTEVICRKLFGHPTTWALDLSTMALFFASVLPAAWVLKRGGHVRIDFIYAFVRSTKQRRTLHVITSIISLFACGVFVWQGIIIFYAAYVDSTLLYRTLAIPKVYYLWAFPVGFFLLCFQIIVNLKKVPK